MKGYDDIFNNVFKDKGKEVLERQMRSTRRVDHIYNKFKDTWVDQSPEKPDRRITGQIEHFIQLNSDKIEQVGSRKVKLEEELRQIAAAE